MTRSFTRRSVVGDIGMDGQSAEGGFAPAQEKYAVVAGIGSGGMGEVLLVQDRDLRRDVAMKVLRPEFAEDAAMKRRFVTEAQATSQLEHPGIPPVHDIGVDADGKVWFTMKVVRGRTLSDLLKDLLLGRKETTAEYTIHKLMTVMERICEAVHFAHEKGVIHRDLKPDNVMLGEFGEVHVMDWGIAKVAASPDELEGAPAGVNTLDTDSGLPTQVGTVKGTIPYMSPEQAHGLPLDRRSDVYSLGAILYEMLTLMPAYEGRGVQLLLKVRMSEFPDVETRNPRRPVHESLARLCRRAMAKEPADRPATAQEIAAELREFLDGRAERERRHKEAEALAAQGRGAMARYAAVRDSIDGIEREAADTESRFEPWQPLAEKRAVHDARRRLTDARRSAALAFAETTKLLDAAVVAEPGNRTARALLAELWRGRLDDAERRGAGDEAAHALTMLDRYDDGPLAAYRQGDGTLELASDPPGARVALVRFEERDGLLVPGPERDLGETPLAPVRLPMGSYLAILRRPGFPDVRYPVHVTRNRTWNRAVRLRTRREIGDGFVYVPGGPFVFGEGAGSTVLDLPDFAIGASPVTFREWGEFLAAVEAERGPEAARALVPSVRGDGEYMERTADGRWVALAVNCEGPARERCLREYGAGFEAMLPVAGVSWREAVAYCEWRTRTTGIEWRLPTEEEREKAARGVDGRRFPWGDLADATLGKCRDSRNEPPQPEPVGAFPAATSVYGMLDASGNSFDWTDSWFDARRSLRTARGGAWFVQLAMLRCAYRDSGGPDERNAMIGLRCARSL